LLDLRMPIVDGIGVATWIVRPHLPTIASARLGRRNEYSFILASEHRRPLKVSHSTP
jgi:hypothetical protein